jgi:hypothetical protein
MNFHIRFSSFGAFWLALSKSKVKVHCESSLWKFSRLAIVAWVWWVSIKVRLVKFRRHQLLLMDDLVLVETGITIWNKPTLRYLIAVPPPMYKHSQAETHCAKRGKAWQAPNMSWRCLWKESLKRQVSLDAIQFLLSTIYQGSGDCRYIAQNPNPSWCNIAMIGVLSAIHPAGPHPFSWPISWIGPEEWLTKCTLESP